MFRRTKLHGYEPGALIHDGMHIKSDDEWLEAGSIRAEDIRKCEQHIEAETGFKMTLSEYCSQVGVPNLFSSLAILGLT